MRLPLALCLVLLACSDMLSPHQLLVGTWSDHNGIMPTTLAAGMTGADLSNPCVTVHFGPLRLDDTLGLVAIGVVTRADGLVGVRVGQAYSIAGHASGHELVLGTDTLFAGGHAPQVCTA